MRSKLNVQISKHNSLTISHGCVCDSKKRMEKGFWLNSCIAYVIYMYFRDLKPTIIHIKFTENHNNNKRVLFYVLFYFLFEIRHLSQRFLNLISRNSSCAPCLNLIPNIRITDLAFRLFINIELYHSHTNEQRGECVCTDSLFFTKFNLFVD